MYSFPKYKGNQMKMIHRAVLSAVTVVVLLGLGGCAEMSHRERNTAIGAGAGAVGGAILTGGSVGGVVGGAAVGGIIGHEVGK